MKKAYKGGYKIISLAGVDLATAEDVEIKGIHKAIESSYRKPILIEDIVIDGVEKQSVFVNELKVVDGSFVIEVYGYELTIADDDLVTATATRGEEIDVTGLVLSSTELEIGENYLYRNSIDLSSTSYIIKNHVLSH